MGSQLTGDSREQKGDHGWKGKFESSEIKFDARTNLAFVVAVEWVHLVFGFQIG